MFLSHTLRSLIAAAAFLALSLIGITAPRVEVFEPRPFPPLGPDDTMEAGDHLPTLAKKTEVAYPAALESKPVNDRVYVAFVVDSKGVVRKARAIFGAHPECELAAVAAVESWAFEPGRHMGKPVSTQMTVEVRFVADDAAPRNP